MIIKNIIDYVGNTPIIKVKTCGNVANIYIKLEEYNPGGSIPKGNCFRCSTKRL